MPVVDRDVAYVYSFVFEDRATGYLSAGGTAVIGLGHGIRNDSVASHPFFGTKRVVDALKECPGLLRGTSRPAGRRLRARCRESRSSAAIDPKFGPRVAGPRRRGPSPP